jgi:hypothetical protein
VGLIDETQPQTPSPNPVFGFGEGRGRAWGRADRRITRPVVSQLTGRGKIGIVFLDGKIALFILVRSWAVS